MKRKIIVVLLVITMMFSAVPFDALAYSATYTIDVGETTYVNASVPEAVHSASWSVTDYYKVEIVSQTSTSCQIKGLSPTNTSYVLLRYDYYYWDDNNGFLYLRSGYRDYRVNVNAVNPTSVSLPSYKTLTAGSYTYLSATVSPSGAQTTLSWSSQNSSIATVNSSGKVTGVSAGTTKIYVETHNGHTDSCSVTVYKKAPVLVSAYPKNGDINVDVNKTITLTYDKNIAQSTAYNSIFVTDTDTGDNIQITKSISGKVLTIVPNNSYTLGHNYRLSVPSNAITGEGDEQFAATSNLTISFQVKPGNLSLVECNPQDGSVGVSTSCIIDMLFNYDIAEGSNYSSISLNANGSTVSGSVSMSNKTLSFVPDDILDLANEYTFTVPQGAIENTLGDENANQFEFGFTTTEYIDSPVINSPEGDLAERDTISITSQIEGATIYYTTDGTIPNANCRQYTSPVSLEPWEHTLKAVVIYNGNASLPVTSNFNIYKESRFDSAQIIGGNYSSVASGTDWFYDAASNDNGVICVGLAGSDSTGDWEGIPRKSNGTDGMIISYDNNNELKWKIRFGGGGIEYRYEKFFGIVDTSDGVVVVGATSVDNEGDWAGYTLTGDYDGTIIKFDYDGNVLWKNRYTDIGETYFYDVEKTFDGYIAVGKAETVERERDAVIVKFDLNGNIVWNKLIGGVSDDYFNAVDITDDAIFAVGFSTENSFGTGNWEGYIGKGDNDATIVKMDFNGNIIWQNNFGASNSDYYKDIKYCHGNLITAGVSRTLGDGDWSDVENHDSYNKGIVVCYDEAGNIQYKKALDNRFTFSYEHILEMEDGYIVSGKGLVNEYVSEFHITAPGGGDAVMVAYDKEGNVVDALCIGGENTDTFTSAVINNNQLMGLGYCSQSSFGTGDLVDYTARGNFDAVMVAIRYHQLLYDANGGISAPSAQESIIGQTLTIPNYSMTKANATFLGWSINRWAKDADYVAGDKIYLDGDTKLYAVWEHIDTDIYGDSTAKESSQIGVSIKYELPSNAKGVCITLKYPSFLSYRNFAEGDTDNVNMTETEYGSYNKLAITSRDITNDVSEFGTVIFDVLSESGHDYGFYGIEIITEESYYIDSSSQNCQLSNILPYAIRYQSSSDTEYMFSLNITDSDGDAVKGAEIKFSGYTTAVSDSNGKAGCVLNGGTYAYTISAPGYNEMNYTITISGNTSQDANGLMQSNYSDVNLDGEVNLLDLAEAAKGHNSNLGDAEYLKKSDVNRDGIINLYDLVLIAKYLA